MARMPWYFSADPVAGRRCSVSANGSSTQISGQAVLATGTFTVTVKNGAGGTASNGVSLAVSAGNDSTGDQPDHYVS